MTLRSPDTTIESERLLLRRITHDDHPFFSALHADPDVARYIGHGQPRTTEESRAWIDRVLETYAAHDLGQLLVIRKSDDRPIGRCGLSFVEIDPAPPDGGDPYGYFMIGEAPLGRPTTLEQELGYTFARDVWGNGFAREAVTTVLEYARTVLKPDRIMSLIHRDNSRSQRLAQHFGCQRAGALRAFGRPLSFDHWAWPSLRPTP
jgi:ribosomal-protein-alanine N-acetyltransferase